MNCPDCGALLASSGRCWPCFLNPGLARHLADQAEAEEYMRQVERSLTD